MKKLPIGIEMKMWVVLVFSLSVSLVTPGAAAWAKTDVFGTLSVDTVWTLSGSPYVGGGILVAAGATLTIEPGVTVKFNANMALRIDGTLIARGTSTENITFTSNSPTPVPGDWGYILFTDTSTDATYDANGEYVNGCILEYVAIMYGGGAEEVYHNGGIRIVKAHPYINNSIIKNNQASGINATDLSGTLKITNNTISSNWGSGIYISTYYGAVLISNNSISDSTAHSGGGIYIDGGTVTVSKNAIFNNEATLYDGGGIALRGGDVSISGNTISNNTAPGAGGGIYVKNIRASLSSNSITGNSSDYGSAIYYGINSSGTVSYNTITQNRIGEYQPFDTDIGATIHVVDTVQPRFNSNNIFGNTSVRIGFYDLYSDTSHSWPDVNAENNWWGNAAEADVIATIYDFLDDSAKGYVDYIPWETTIRSDAPVSPPTGLALAPSGNVGEISISWNPNSESDLAGYRVYWGPENTYPFPNMVDVGNATSHTLTGLSAGVYEVSVTAYDTTDTSITNDPATPVYEKQTSGHESWHSTLTAYSDSHALTVVKTGTGGGVVTDSPVAVDCGSDCLAVYASGTQVTLSAKADTGSTFTGWSEAGCTGIAPCTVTMNANTTVTATFTTNSAPVADFGDARVAIGEVTLDGSQSSDPDGTIIAWEWSLTHRSDPSLNRNGSGEVLTLADLAPGFYDVVLTVSDNHGEIGEDHMLLGVADASGLYTQDQVNEELDQAIYNAVREFDVNQDGQVGLEEAINALQVVSGVRSSE